MLSDFAASGAFGSNHGQQFLFSIAQVFGPFVRAVDLLGLHAPDEGRAHSVDDFGQADSLAAFETDTQQVGVGNAGHYETFAQAFDRFSLGFFRQLPQVAALTEAGQRVAQHVVATDALALVLDKLAVLGVGLEVQFLVFAQVAHVARSDLDRRIGDVMRLALLPRQRDATDQHQQQRGKGEPPVGEQAGQRLEAASGQ